MIRKLTKEDIPEYQHLITTVWNETYPGIINDKFLKSLYQGEQVRIELDLYMFNEQTNKILVIEENNKLVGFTRYGKSSDKLYPNTGEIFSLYVLKEYHHKGYGKQLVQEAVKELIKLNYSSMVIGCISLNPSNEFYKHIGGIHKSTRVLTQTGDTLTENIYYYEDIKKLI